MPDPTNLTEEIAQIEAQLLELKKRRTELIHQLPNEAVRNYELKQLDGNTIRVSELFGDKNDLLVVHNMGRRCAYCTLWADGFIGLLPHLESRAAFALVSHDPPDVAADFAASRQWNFRVLSGEGSDFTAEMGFWNPEDGAWPGFSAFHRNPDGSIVRTGKMFFGPGDDFCSVWHFFDALKDGQVGWEPQFRYP